jgi:DNA ligase-1
VKAFADLYAALDETTKTNEKVEALVRYFAQAAAADAAWAVFFLVGRKPRQVVPSARLWAWACQAAGIPDWLFTECYDAVGDIAETVALLLPAPQQSSDLPLHHWVEDRLLPLRGMAEADQKSALLQAWQEMDDRQRYVWNKLITGAFRVGVSQQLVTRALAQVSGREQAVIAHRLMGDWQPTPAFYEQLIAADQSDANVSRPYPFFLAHPLADPPASLGDVAQWQAEWKWDGIRSQLIHRASRLFLWTRGEELVTERYPELAGLNDVLPDGIVIDAEILPWKKGHVLPFGDLQRRIGRKTLGKKILDEVPVVLMAYDLLEEAGEDIRSRPLRERRARLAALVERTAAVGRLLLSPVVPFSSWEELAQRWQESRERDVEGLMLKRVDSPYGVGRQRGQWWKWKINPFTIDAVLMYAQRGSGKRASLYTDYTFGVWNAGRLVPIAKAYSGLTDEEIRRVDAFVRHNTIEKFGPVRTVKPELVFELAFEGIRRSTRHKSGVAVRFPRMARWRTDKSAAEADSLENVQRLLPANNKIASND